VTGSTLLEGLDARDTGAVLAAATTRRFPAQAILYEQGWPANQVLLLTKGRARYFYITPDGRKVLLHWLIPGHTLGMAALLETPSIYRVSAETVHESSMLIWDRKTMLMLLEQYPRLVRNAVAIGVGYLDWYIAAHAALISDTARQRLASVLARLAETIGRETPAGVELQVTNEELANAAHITLFTASRILNEWQDERALTKGRGRIVLHSPKRLFRLTA
jgi:CRP/FNR family transcriptional regulator, nitrogen oxide reductase regulator